MNMHNYKGFRDSDIPQSLRNTILNYYRIFLLSCGDHQFLPCIVAILCLLLQCKYFIAMDLAFIFVSLIISFILLCIRQVLFMIFWEERSSFILEIVTLF